MHEFSLIIDLLRKIESVADDHRAQRIVGVSVRIGALSHISADHFRGHFIEGARNTRVEGARLDIKVSHDSDDPHAQDVLLERVEIA